jgi:hypothetical protein
MRGAKEVEKMGLKLSGGDRQAGERYRVGVKCGGVVGAQLLKKGSSFELPKHA